MAETAQNENEGNLTKSELVNIIQKETGLSSKGKAEATLNSLLSNITECLSRGEDVNISEFGSFRRIRRNERQGRNPQTGESLTIPAGFRIKFKPAKKLKEEMNDDPTLNDQE
jgi:DNA-binding protein HU-beta